MAIRQRNLEVLQIGSMLSTAVKTIAATGNETGVDFLGFDGDLVIRMNFAAAGAGNSLDCRIEESDEAASGYTAVSGGTFTQIGNAAGGQTLTLPKDRLKRYLRFSVTARGGTASVPMSVDYIGVRKYQ